MLPRENHLKARKDFRLVYKKGRAVPLQSLVLYYKKNNGNKESFRVGFSVSKKIGNAVVRNRVKRCLRAASRDAQNSFRPGYDYIIVARVKAKNVHVNVLRQDIERALAKSTLRKA